jgi:phosphoribosylformylglycinamidine synthase
VRVRSGGVTYVDLPATLVAGGAPASAWLVARALPTPKAYPAFEPLPAGDTLLALLADPGLRNAEPLYSRYDSTVGNRTVRGPGQAAAAVQKLPDSRRGFALTITGRGEVCAAHPYLGAQAALGDACRDLACVGAELLAITDGLNMASPRDPVENLKLAEVIRGLKDGLNALGVPVTGGNVSLYNESPSGPIPPTPMVGGLGVIEDIRQVPTLQLAPDHALILLGAPSDAPCFSHFARVHTDVDTGDAPAVDLAADKRLASFLVSQVRRGRIRAAKGAGLGGLAVSLAKLCLASGCGARVTLPEGVRRADWALFGERPALAWVSVASGDDDALLREAQAAGVPAHRAGMAGGDRLVMGGFVGGTGGNLPPLIDVPLARLVDAASGGSLG